jgi:hypothetical protein
LPVRLLDAQQDFTQLMEADGMMGCLTVWCWHTSQAFQLMSEVSGQDQGRRGGRVSPGVGVSGGE